MRILLSYFFGENQVPLGHSIADALAETGHEVICFDSSRQYLLDRPFFKRIIEHHRVVNLVKESQLPGTAAYHRRTGLEKSIKRTRPDMLLVMLGWGYEPGFIRYLRLEYKIPEAVAWFVRNTDRSEDERVARKDYDFFFSISDWSDSRVDFWYLPALARDDKRYYRMPGVSTRDEIVMVGDCNARREKFLAAAQGLPVVVYGDSWKQSRLPPSIRRQPGIWGKALTRLYNEAAIVLNISKYPCYSGEGGGANLRLVDVPLCGGFLLTETSRELRELFPEVADAVSFSTPDEMRVKLEHHLGSRERRRAIAASCMDRVKRFPTYRELVSAMLAAIQGGQWLGFSLAPKEN